MSVNCCKLKRMRWAGRVTHMGKIINTSKRWPEKSEQEIELQRTRLTWESNNIVNKIHML
jgi:hypothetical protein